MASNWMYSLAKTPLIGRAALAVYRAAYGTRYVLPPVRNLIKWVFTSREVYNYTYHLAPMNRSYLASFLSAATHAAPEVFEAYFRELEEDRPLQEHLLEMIRGSKENFQADREIRYGRRIGWYALARHLKPRVILETGVDKGLGACVLASALIRNQREGYSGRYIGTDINPRAGYFLSAPYNSVAEVLYGDSIDSIKTLKEPVGLYINDSDHSAAYEAREYESVGPLLSDSAFMIGDNAHVTDELRKFCLATGRTFNYFQDQPHQHWYPGAGIGLGFRPPALPAPGIPDTSVQGSND